MLFILQLYIYFDLYRYSPPKVLVQNIFPVSEYPPVYLVSKHLQLNKISNELQRHNQMNIFVHYNVNSTKVLLKSLNHN